MNVITLQVSVKCCCVSSGVNGGAMVCSDNGVTMVTMTRDNVNTLAVSPGQHPTLLLLH